MSTSARPMYRSIEHPDLTIHVTALGEQSVVVELCGVVRASTVNAVAAEVSGLRAAALVVDLSGITLSNYWLLSGLAKAHAARLAHRAAMRLIMGDDETFETLHTSGLYRVIPTLFTRGYSARLDAQLAMRNRADDRQSVIDHTIGHSYPRGRAHVLTAKPTRVAVPRVGSRA